MQRSIDILKSRGDCGRLAGRYLNLAMIYLKMGDRRSEFKAYLDGYEIRLNCDSSEIFNYIGTFARNLGYFHMTNGNYREALRYFKEAESIYDYTTNSLTIKKYHAQQASNIARVYQHWGKLDSAMSYRQIALQRFWEYGFTERTHDIPNQYCYIGTIYRDWGDMKTARDYIERSLTLRKIIPDSMGIGMSLDELARIAKLNGEYIVAVDYLKESLVWKSCVLEGRIDAFRYAQQVETRSDSYLIMGQVFLEWGKQEDAQLYFDTAQLLARQVQYSRGESMIEYNRGIAFQKAGNPDSAYHHFKIALELADEIDNLPLIARARAGLGILYLELQEYGRARQELESALDIYLENGFTRELPEIYLNLGKVFSARKDLNRANDAFQNAYDQSERMGMLPIQSEAARELASLYEAEGKVSLSHYYLKQYILWHDSIFTLETHRQLAEMQAMHESRQKELAISQLQQTNELNMLQAERSQYIIISLGGIVVIVLLFAILFIRQIRIRNEQQALINQQRLFRSQMNPHFIFNSLTNIQHYIFSNDPRAAGKYLAIFARLMRGILNHSSRELISLRDELATIEQYLQLQQLRMEHKLQFEIAVDESLDQELTEIPPMLAQPFIENAIEHGIRNLEVPGKVSIRMNGENGYLLYEVEDNGVGRKKATELKLEKHKKHESMAVALTRTRLQSLWGRKNPGKVFEIIDLFSDTDEPSGTLVRFKVPI